MKPKVLLIEDSTSLAILYKQYIKDEPYDLFHVETVYAITANWRAHIIRYSFKLSFFNHDFMGSWVRDELKMIVSIENEHSADIVHIFWSGMRCQ